MSTNEKLIYGWTMHLLQVGRYGKHGPDFITRENHHCNMDKFTGLSPAPATWRFISLYLKQNSIIEKNRRSELNSLFENFNQIINI